MKTVKATFLLTISCLSRAIATSEGLDDVPCRTRAWVRAPNLEPGQIVQGHVKVKLDGACDNVSSYRLGLRFAERSWVKTRRTGVILPSNPYDVLRKSSRQHPIGNLSDIYEPEAIYWPTSEINEFDLDQYKSNIKNPDLWLVREEERIAFQTSYPLKFDVAQDSNTGIVRSFALLVPSTIYPPVFNTHTSTRSSNDENSADAEHSYMYFVDVTFSNGTHREVEAGYTSFSSPVEPLNGPTDIYHDGQGRTKSKVGPESVNVTASGRNCDSSEALNIGAEDSLEANNTIGCDKFTLEIIFPEGRHFEQGSTNNISIKSHQIGPGLTRPLSIQYFSARIEQKRHWAAKHAADNKSAEVLLNSGWMYDKEIWPEANDDFPRASLDWGDLPRFSQQGVVQNGTMYSTEAVSAQIKVPPHAYPSFEMYYQTSEVKLTINIAVRNVSGTASGHNVLEKEEYDWVPMLQEEPNYGIADVIQSTIPIYVHRKPEYRVTRIPRVVHYLSPEARAPVFVDPSNLAHLLQMTTEDRNNLAPLAQPKFTSQADGDVVKKRYFPRYDQIYVGHTWLRKVVAKGRDKEAAQQGGTLIVQT